MKDIFDMFSGTSTGSIMSAGLSLNADYSQKNAKSTVDKPVEPKFWATAIRDIYITNAKEIFKRNYLNSI
jgi:patatin-like phospholipase/acyl hydrolase